MDEEYFDHVQSVLSQFIISESQTQNVILGGEIENAEKKVQALQLRIDCLEKCRVSYFIDPKNLPGTTQEETKQIMRQQMDLMEQGKIMITIPEDIEDAERLFWQKNQVKERGQVAVQYGLLIEIIMLLVNKASTLIETNMDLQHKMLDGKDKMIMVQEDLIKHQILCKEQKANMLDMIKKENIKLLQKVKVLNTQSE